MPRSDLGILVSQSMWALITRTDTLDTGECVSNGLREHAMETGQSPKVSLRFHLCELLVSLVYLGSSRVTQTKTKSQ